MPPPGPETPADQVDRLATRAIIELDRLAKCGQDTRPPHLAQLSAVLGEGVQQARQAQAGSAAVNRASEVWKLREPGYLRAIVEYPIPRPGSTLPLVPVVLTWAILGIAEYSYVKDFTSIDAVARPSFFADWMTQPLWRGPVGLSFAIVVTVLVIMWRHRGPAKAQNLADDVDRVVHRLEVDLLAPLAVLRSGLAPLQVAEHTRQAAVELSAAARQFSGATRELAGATTVVDRLVAGADRLIATLPELGKQAERLAEVREELDRTAGVITSRLDPLASVVSDVSGAAEAAQRAVDVSERVMSRSFEQLVESRSIADRHVGHTEALAAAQAPFTAVADVVAQAAGRLDSTSALLQKTVAELGKVVDEVNWLALVSDGLRAADDQHEDNR
ncbi:hypothetical protein [Lentzea sp. NEAU-D7]|uniref:hypothetical protein n=1 Tax=Lentzea sp. NEAU-D7 TaxID=2994667 RepID=UPI00224B4411|nr:hypothetical protein [Lentzea sp. NEAU-D7]MCX2949693.1 hypothetical protein [Lentzea sp. NEAU-D7]